MTSIKTLCALPRIASQEKQIEITLWYIYAATVTIFLVKYKTPEHQK